ncbi:DEAD/DEAH box helicase family protein [Janibacter anophelis]|uniref:DEAD/DEAH box helicase family protein n=1 Tax=Janibacter anophelis TaxID=319054 RepID=UPI000DEF949A|nr:DEAD/DEAH box helicase family protein [Janibacter anophelis]
MSNFAFIKAEWPDIHADCVRGESYLASDPRTACFYARRAAEGVVHHLYDVMALPVPYKDDLAARTNDPGFKTKTGTSITQKLNLIRNLGNKAVHDATPIPAHAALTSLRELHHVVIWAAFRYSTTPNSVPMGTKFDPALAQKAAPLSRAELNGLITKFKEQDEAHAAQLAAKDELAAAKDAEIEQLKAEIAAAQAAKTQTADTHDYDEAQTRSDLIDLLLGEAGWPLSDTQDREYEVSGMPNATGVGYVDYVLWGSDGLPLAVVEAKRTTTSAGIGQQQAKLYADRLEAQFGRRPVIFYSNGLQHWLWDDASGYPPREIQGFFTRDELELLIQRRHSRRPLASENVNPDIAGRPYQVRAIAAVGDAFDRRQRDALLVMATGSGKTRTTIALVDQLMRAGWVKRVLFLADRTALVSQAARAFTEHLPDVATVNLVTNRSGSGRVYASTYPTMMNLINELSDDSDPSVVKRKFGPGYFDLVVIDEAHRSVYQKYGAIFDWFDGLLVGLTATPKDEVDHNTYRLFHLEDGVPTDAYSLDEAVADGYLVPPKGVSVATKFLRQGIRYDELRDEEKDQWDLLDWGEDGTPTEVGAEAINRFLFNEDTVDQVLATLMGSGYKVAGGDRLGKTIVFAKSQQHADFIQKRFDIAWPEYGGQFARTITHGTPYAQSLIDDFSIPGKAPHIAISVDMLDTGIDVPDVVNLVFFKAVRSKSKFWQMIGRGTRLRPDLFGPGQDKQDFLVFDFCGNLEYFSQDLPGSEGSLQKSLAQRLFEGRVGLITALDKTKGDAPLRESAADLLHRVVAGMNLDNFLVRPHREWVERYGERSAWDSLSTDEANDLVAHLAGLPSSTRDDDEDAKRFDLVILRRQLAQLDGDLVLAERLRETVQEVAVALLGKTAIPSVAAQAELLEELANDVWWVDVTLPMLELARLRIRDLVRLIERTKHNPVYTDFADELGEATEVTLPGTTPGTDMERFRAKAAAYLREHESHVALQRLRRNRQLTPDDLTALAQMLEESGAGGQADIERAVEQSDGLGRFVRSLVGLDRAAAMEVFADYLDGARFDVHQVRFVTLIVDELTTNGIVDPGRLFESPYTDHAPMGPDGLFDEGEVDSIVGILREVDGRAEAVGA